VTLFLGKTPSDHFHLQITQEMVRRRFGVALVGKRGEIAEKPLDGLQFVLGVTGSLIVRPHQH
jgi:hypothetical protein